MIPKIIHYCWFGGNPKSELFIKCYNSWKRYCPDYKIIEWNEDNFDISSCPLYVRQAYEAKKWAFVTDYVRLKVVYDKGGIYLDTDVELKKSLNCFIEYNAFFGFEDGKNINTGHGFGTQKGLQLLMEIMQEYSNIPFILEDGSFDLSPCPIRNTETFLQHGLVQNNKRQMLDENILILPTIYLCPIDVETGKLRKSFHTVSIHWFDASWKSKEQKEKSLAWLKQKQEIERNNIRENIIHIPNRILRFLLGKRMYEKVKRLLK